MQLLDGYSNIPPGKIASIVTHLEMLAQVPARMVLESTNHLALRRVHTPAIDWYRDLYTRVGADWLWFSRLAMTATALEKCIQHADVEVHALVTAGAEEGLLHLDFRTSGECELAVFGVTLGLIGSGAGRFLMNAAIAAAWARPIRRFWVHTRTLDHPAAVAFYRRSGFVPFRQQVEIADDPRLSGYLPMTAAQQTPIYSRTGEQG
jgi:GNAT superfamily N-acetyltransferase